MFPTPAEGLTLALKSGGSVFAPVRRFTRKAFQFEYLCCIPERDTTIRTTSTVSVQENQQINNSSFTKFKHLLFGGTRGLLLEAHQPTGCTSGMHKLHQKSLLLSLSKPSYRRSALNPAEGQETPPHLQFDLDFSHRIFLNMKSDAVIFNDNIQDQLCSTARLTLHLK